MTLVVRAAMTEQPISLSEHEELVGHRSAGAVVGFVGMIRDHDGGRRVVRLEYSAHPSAAQVMADVIGGVAPAPTPIRTVPNAGQSLGSSTGRAVHATDAAAIASCR